MVRILIVTPWYPTADAPHSGLFVAREAAALREAHDVHVLHLDWTGPAADDGPGTEGVERIRLRRGAPGDYARARSLVSGAAGNADIVHTHALTLLLPWLRGRVTDKPWVHSEHWSGLTSPETLGLAERAALRLLRGALARPDVVVAESGRLAAAIAKHRAGPIELVPCVVPEVAVVEPPRDGVLRLIGIGGMIPRKGPLVALEALALLRERGQESTLAWVGDGGQRDEAIDLAGRLGVDRHFEVTGILPSDAVGARLDQANMLLLPTLGDNFCVVAAEALTHGRPLVSGAHTGAVDYSRPEVSRFVDDQTGEAYADAVLDLWRAVRDLPARDIADTVEGRFTPDAVRSALERVYAGIGVP